MVGVAVVGTYSLAESRALDLKAGLTALVLENDGVIASSNDPHLAMGIAGAGNSGTVLAVLFAPPLAAKFGWQTVYGLAAFTMVIPMIVMAIAAKEPPDREHQTFREHIACLFEKDGWAFSLIYVITFGGFIGLANFLPTYFYDQFKVTKVEAGQLTMLATLMGSATRVVGGWMSDRWGGVNALTAVLAMVMLRLEQAGEGEAAVLTASLAECFVDDMDGQLRQIGVGDLMVGKHIGKMMAMLGGRLGAYRDALEQGAAAMDAALASGLSLTALVCANDLLALGAIRALRAHGLSIPEDVSVVGYDDIEFAANAAVPLTSVRQPKYEMGYSAAKLIIGECEDPSSHVHQAVQFQPQLIERQSTAAAARREP